MSFDIGENLCQVELCAFELKQKTTTVNFSVVGSIHPIDYRRLCREHRETEIVRSSQPSTRIQRIRVSTDLCVEYLSTVHSIKAHQKITNQMVILVPSSQRVP